MMPTDAAGKMTLAIGTPDASDFFEPQNWSAILFSVVCPSPSPIRCDSTRTSASMKLSSSATSSRCAPETRCQIPSTTAELNAV